MFQLEQEIDLILDKHGVFTAAVKKLVSKVGACDFGVWWYAKWKEGSTCF